MGATVLLLGAVRLVWYGEVRVASRGQEIISVASQDDRFKCISCVPRWLLQVFQLRPPVRKELYQLRPGLSTPNMTSCVPRLVRNCVSCIERHGCTKCPTIGKFLQFYCTLLYTQLYTHIQNCWNRQHSCYIMLLS